MTPPPTVTGAYLINALIAQVTKAAAGGSELNVVTRISRPMWRMWNEANGHHPDTEPTAWLGQDLTRRVYGSETIVVDDPGLWAVSKKRA